MGELWLDVVGFVVAAAVVWTSGRALAGRAELIADRTGMGRVFTGAIVLAAATSLPEIATTLFAAGVGAGSLAGNNLLGGVAMQVAVLAAVDGIALRGRALTRFSPNSSLLLHGVFLILLLAIATAAITGPDLVIGGRVSVWAILLAVVYAGAIYCLRRYDVNPSWTPREEVAAPPQSAVDMQDAVRLRFEGASLATIAWQFALLTVVVFVGGYVVASTGESIAEHTGLGETFVGATLVAGATSLPEFSTTYGAVRLGAYSMAVSNIMGTNALEVALFLPADLAYADGSVFGALDGASVMLAMVGIAVTAIYLWGTLERRDRVIMGFGVDSMFVLIAYAAGMTIFAVMS